MIKNIALREQLLWLPCKIDLEYQTIEHLDLIAIDEIKNSIFFKKIIFKKRFLIYYNQNSYGFCFDISSIENKREDEEKYNNEIKRAENGVLNKIVELKQRGRQFIKKY